MMSKAIHLTLSFCLVAMTILTSSCMGKSKKSTVKISGLLRLPEELKKDLGENSAVFIGISDTPFHVLVDDPLASTKMYVASKDTNKYEIEFEAKIFDGSKKDIQIFAFIDRDFSPQQSPRLSRGDFIGFYVNDLKPGLSVDFGSTRDIRADIEINRRALGRRVHIEVENTDPLTGLLQFGLYCAEIENLAPRALKMEHIVYVRPLLKPGAAVKEKFAVELFQAKSTDHCYAFLFHDVNENMKLDDEEQFGFYSDRTDGLPTQIDIRPENVGPLRITLKYKLPPPRNQPIVLRGSVKISPELRAQFKRLFVIAVRHNEKGLKLENISQQVLGFTSVPADGGPFEIDLTQSQAKLGEQVTVFALGDKSDRGLPSLAEGDRIGLPIEEQTLVTKNLREGINDGFIVTLDRTYYEGKATIDVSLVSDYRGKVVLLAYGGELITDQTPSLENIRGIDPKNIYGLSLVEKVSQSVTEPVEVLSIGSQWPLDIYLLGLQDLNGNMKADPGEILLLPLDDEGKPQRLRLTRSDRTRFELKFPYPIPLPSPYSIVLKGRFHIGQGNMPKYVTVMVADNVEIDQIVTDPRRYVKIFQKIPASAKSFSLSLLNTPFKPGDQIQILAITTNDEIGFPKLDENSLVGFYSQNNKLGYKLKDGTNEGLDVVIDKTTYRDRISVVGILDNSYRGPVIASLFSGNPLNLLNQKYELDDFIAFANLSKETNRMEIKWNDFVTNKRLPVRGFPLLIEDRNGNEWPDPGETVHFAYRDNQSEPLFLDINVGSVFSFVFNHQSAIPQPSQQKIIVKGKVNVSGSVEAAKIYVLALDPDLKSISPSEISRKIYAIQEVSLTNPLFQLDLGKTGRNPGDKILLAALVDRDFQDFPRFTKNDLLGFYSGQNAWTYELKEGESETLEITVDRPLYDGEAVVEGEISVPLNPQKTKRLVAVAYAGPLDTLTDIEVDPNHIVGYVQLGSVNRFEMKITPLGINFPLTSTVFVLNDLNGNQRLDPGESLFYPSTRSDRIPERLLMNQGQRYQVKINQEILVPIPKGHNITIRGQLSWLRDDQIKNKPVYLFIARTRSFEELSLEPLKSMRYLKKIEGFPTDYQINLASTDLAPGDAVIIGAWIDNDESQGPSVGDRIGTHIKGLEGYVLTIPDKDLTEINIPVDKTLYGTKKSLDVAFLSSTYSGRVLAAVYKGALRGISLTDIEIQNVVGFTDFQKAASTMSFSLPVLPTQQLPIESVTVFALLDANANGRPDPEEKVVFFSAKANGLPQSFALSLEHTGTLSLNSSYVIQKPAGRPITLTGVIDSNVASANNYPTAVAVFKEAPLDRLTQEPLRFLKDFRILPPGQTEFSLDLSPTDLVEDQKVMMLAVQNPVGDKLMQTQVVEGAFVGLLLNESTLQTSWTLKTGKNTIDSEGYAISVKRKYYDHLGKISQISLAGSLPFTSGDSLMLAAYQSEINPTNLASLVNVDYDKVVSIENAIFQSPTTKYQSPILQALVPGVVKEDTREIQNVLLIAWKDRNKNGRLEDNEPIGFYCDPTNPLLPTSLTLRLTNNQFPGSIRFNGEQQTIGFLRGRIDLGIPNLLALNICL